MAASELGTDEYANQSEKGHVFIGGGWNDSDEGGEENAWNRPIFLIHLWESGTRIIVFWDIVGQCRRENVNDAANGAIDAWEINIPQNTRLNQL